MRSTPPARPPLHALHVFATVVREGGVRAAAQALCVTPGAVSRQLQALQETLPRPLFDHQPGGAATLSPAGRQLYARVSGPLEAIHAALDGASPSGARSVVRVNTSVTLAMHWLIPQLREFSQRFPRYHVQVTTSDGPVSATRGAADVYLRRDPGELTPLAIMEFLQERSVLVAAEALVAASRGPIATGLRRLPRISSRSRPDLWPSWCAAHGVPAARLEPALEFDNTILAIQAAAQGLGCLVVPEIFAAPLLSAGALRRLGGGSVATGSYSLAIAPGRNSARVAAFTGWLRALGRPARAT
jgi:LysR family glycine cleavage system transcriptional activator